MKSNRLASLLLALGIAGAVVTTTAWADDKLAAKAKISQADAEKTALEKVPGGKIKEGELEEENGKLIWSFDIAIPDSKNIKEIQVDAITGKIVSEEIETPKDQDKEADKDKEEAKEKGEKHGKKHKSEEKHEKE